jgi:hypothetical protein
MSIRALSLVMLTACLDQPTTAEVAQAVNDTQCPIWQCGSNSPHIDTLDFHDVNKYGLPNAAGFRIVSFKKDSVPYQIDVGNGRLIGRDAQGLGVLFGAQLAGSKILMINDTTHRQYLIQVLRVGSVKYWARHPIGPQPVRESYELKWVLTLDGVTPAPNERYQNLCKLAGRVNARDLLGMNGFHTVLFEGDRIDAAAKTIDPRIDTDWFNLGCAGHTLAKLELTGHTEVASYRGYPTTIAQRQTILKMFVADYTGTGIPYTVAGMPLSWADDNHWMVHQPDLTKIESRWTKDGAECLEQPRGAAHWTQELADAFPLTNGDIELELGEKRPGSCKNPSWDEFDGIHLITVNVE